MTAELLSLYRQSHGLPPTEPIPAHMSAPWLSAMKDLYTRRTGRQITVTDQYVDPGFLAYVRDLCGQAARDVERRTRQKLLFE